MIPDGINKAAVTKGMIMYITIIQSGLVVVLSTVEVVEADLVPSYE